MINFDHVLERIGAFKNYQLFHYIILGIAGIPVGMHALANVFLAGVPEFYCNVETNQHQNGLEANSTSTPSLASPYHCSYPSYLDSYDTHNTTDTAHRDQHWYQQHHGGHGDDIKKSSCKSWTYDTSMYGETIVTEWDLVCSRAWMRATAQSIYMLGFLVGAIGFGSLSDRIGRKLSWMIATIFLIVSGVAAAFVPSYWGHVWLRFISGTTSGGAFTCAFVLEMEIIGVEKRMVPGIFYQGFFAIGYMLLALIAHFIRDYFTLQLIISLLPILMLGNYWLVSESPRWLITQTRYTEAADVIKRAARMNKVDYPHDLVEKATTGRENKQVTDKKQSVETYTFFDLLKTPKMRKRSINVFFNWFVNSFVYYGLTLSAVDLAGTPYVNTFISGVAEFGGFVLCILTVDRFGRRVPLAAMLFCGGTACLITTIVPENLWILETTFAMLGKLCISGSFALIYVFSAELFPTVVRTIGVGAGSMHARMGSLVAPFVAELGKLVWPPLPIIIFGTSALIAGVLSFLLPETLHKPLPETMEDGEKFGMDQDNTIFGCCKKPKRDSEVEKFPVANGHSPTTNEKTADPESANHLLANSGDSTHQPIINAHCVV